MLRGSGAASHGRVVSARRCCLFADRNLLDVRNGCSVDADSMAEHSIGAQREQAGFVLESPLHLIKVLLNDDRSPSGEVNLSRHYSLHLESVLARLTLRVAAELHATCRPPKSAGELVPSAKMPLCGVRIAYPTANATSATSTSSSPRRLRRAK
jgi:hypothetical protein